MEILLGIIGILLALIAFLFLKMLQKVSKLIVLIRSQIDKGFLKKLDIVFKHVTGNNGKIHVSIDSNGKTKKELIDRSY